MTTAPKAAEDTSLATIHHAIGWAPPAGVDIETQPAGRWWDAVRVPLHIGRPALDELADDSGAVIEDPHGSRLYWLIPPGSADTWTLQHVVVLGSTCHVAVPPAHRTSTPGVHWRVPPDRGRTLTPPALLHAALGTALDDTYGPRP